MPHARSMRGRACRETGMWRGKVADMLHGYTSHCTSIHSVSRPPFSRPSLPDLSSLVVAIAVAAGSLAVWLGAWLRCWYIGSSSPCWAHVLLPFRGFQAGMVFPELYIYIYIYMCVCIFIFLSLSLSIYIYIYISRHIYGLIWSKSRHLRARRVRKGGENNSNNVISI